MDNAFGLALGFAYIHIGLAGVILALIGCVASLLVWLSRGKILNALPSALVVLALPPMLLGVIPGAESIAVPMALAAAFVAFYLHIKVFGTEHSTKIDKILAAALGLGLAAIVISYVLGSLTAAG